MDEEYGKRGSVAPLLKKKPSDYVRSGKIYFSCEADECLLPQALQLIGEEQVVYASDYPHWDGSYPHSLGELRGREDLTDAQKRKLLADNARRLYKINAS
jgi:predicted TIM-barrel fold metal-dependent hydrolase